MNGQNRETGNIWHKTQDKDKTKAQYNFAFKRPCDLQSNDLC